MTQRKFALCLSLSTFACGGCSDPEGDLGSMVPSSEVPAAAPATVASLAGGLNAFTADVFRGTPGDGNRVLSPVSVALGLLMVREGATGETASELERALHLQGSHDAASRAASNLLRRWSAPVRTPERRSGDYAPSISVAARLFADERLDVEAAFVDKTGRLFGARLQRLDIGGKPTLALERINAWIRDRTRNLVPALLPSGSVSRRTKLVVANAVHFSSGWLNAHVRSGEMTFHGPAGDVRVPRLSCANCQVGLGELASPATFVRIPYYVPDFVFVAIVPHPGTTLTRLEADLTGKSLDTAIQGGHVTKVELEMPPFEIGPRTSVDMQPVLQSLGVRRLFDNAELTKVARSTLSVEAIYHQAVITLNERGTEAASATGVTLVERGAADLARPERFVVDRPFVFLVADKAAGVVLHIGRVVDPTG